jgi:hypothetical protein
MNKQHINNFIEDGYTVSLRYKGKYLEILVERGDEPKGSIISDQLTEEQMLELLYTMVTGDLDWNTELVNEYEN